MTVKRYFAATARDCLRKVKEDLGPDAIVVSNKSVRGGVEVTAMSAASLEEISSRATEYVDEERLVAAGGSRHASAYAAGYASPAAQPGPADDDYRVSISTQGRRYESQSLRDGTLASPKPPAARPGSAPTVTPWQPPRYEPATGKVTPQAAQPAPPEKRRAEPAAPTQKTTATSRVPHEGPNLAVVHELTREMQEIRGMLEQQLAGFAWGELSRTSPVRAQLMTELLEMGFSGVLARRMTQSLAADASMEAGRKHMTEVLDSRLQLLDADHDLIHKGGVYALVGPTGVGKTTTTAKLAARCVMRYGADRVALLTTDGYRIGAYEQLKIYGRILGVAVHAVSDAEELRYTLATLKDKHMVLIDTVGMSQRDRMVLEQRSMLANGGAVKRLLLLGATSRGDTLDDVIQAYGGADIAGCIISKVDETVTLAPAIDAVVRHGMQICYLANGQRVPEDMHLPNRKYILHRVFKQRNGNLAHRLQESEAGMIIAAGATQPYREAALG